MYAYCYVHVYANSAQTNTLRVEIPAALPVFSGRGGPPLLDKVLPHASGEGGLRQIDYDMLYYDNMYVMYYYHVIRYPILYFTIQYYNIQICIK